MTAFEALLEGFESAAHPRGWHGRWIGTSSGKVLRVFHGDTHIGDAKPGSGRDELVQNVAGVISGADRGVGHGEIAALINHAKGSPAPTPRVIPKGSAGAAELRGGIPRSSLADIRREQALRAGAPHRAGDKVHVVTPQGHVDRGVVEKPAESYDAITSRGTERSRTVQVRWQDGDVTHERPQDLSPGHPPQRLPTTRRATLGKAQGDAAARTRAEILAKSPSAAADLAQHQDIARGAHAAAADPLHARLTSQLENLPAGRYHHLPGLGDGGSLAQKTSAGYAVYRALHATPEKVHKTPSAAAAHMIRIRNAGLREGEMDEPRPDLLGSLLSERFVSQGSREDLAKEGKALKVGGKIVFPINSRQDAENAKTLYQSGHHQTEQARKHIIRNARRVGALGVVKALSKSGDSDNDSD